MKLLAMHTADLDAESHKKLALDWIKRYRDELKAIIAADDGAQMVGIIEACKQAGRGTSCSSPRATARSAWTG